MMTYKQAFNIEPVTTNLGIMKWGTTWHVMDLESQSQVGCEFKTKTAACAYAFHRQNTTYS
jgi:hypothetical protein